jgi:hypothetical protein
VLSVPAVPVGSEAVAGRRPFRGGANGSEVDRTLGVCPAFPAPTCSLLADPALRGTVVLTQPEGSSQKYVSSSRVDEAGGRTSRMRHFTSAESPGRRQGGVPLKGGSGTSRVCDPISWPASFQCAEGKQSARVVATMNRHRAHGRSESPRRRHASLISRHPRLFPPVPSHSIIPRRLRVSPGLPQVSFGRAHSTTMQIEQIHEHRSSLPYVVVTDKFYGPTSCRKRSYCHLVFYLAPNTTSQCPTAPMTFPYPTSVAVTPLLTGLVGSGHSKIVRQDCPDSGSPIAVPREAPASSLVAWSRTSSSFIRRPNSERPPSPFPRSWFRHSLSSSCFLFRVAASSSSPSWMVLALKVPSKRLDPRLAFGRQRLRLLLGLVMFFM